MATVPGKKDKAKDPVKSKPVPPTKVTEIWQKSNGKYKKSKDVTDILATIDCTAELPQQFLTDRGIRV